MAEKTITDFMQYKIDKGGEKWFATLAALSFQPTLTQITQEINCLALLWKYAAQYGDVADIMAKTDPAEVAMLYTLIHLHAGNLRGIAERLKDAMLAGGYEYTPEQVQERRRQIDSKVETFYQNESIAKRHLDAVFDIAHEVQAERQQATGAGAESPTGEGVFRSYSPIATKTDRPPS